MKNHHPIETNTLYRLYYKAHNANLCDFCNSGDFVFFLNFSTEKGVTLYNLTENKIWTEKPSDVDWWFAEDDETFVGQGFISMVNDQEFWLIKI